MRPFAFLVFLLGIILLASLPAEAVLITFEEPTRIPAGVTLRYFDGGKTGPLSSLPTPNSDLLKFDFTAVPDGGDEALLVNSIFNETIHDYGVLFTFDTPQSFVSAIGNDFGGDPVDDNETAHITAFDSSGNVLGSSSFSSPFATPNLKPVSFSYPSNFIKYAAFTYTNDIGFYMMDNAEFKITDNPQEPNPPPTNNPVIPEPASLALFGLGGLAILRKRFKKTTAS